jgi:type I restriction enzyme, S subunit
VKAWPEFALGQIAPIIRRAVEIDSDATYREIGARSFGKGLFAKPDFPGSRATWQRPVWIKAGDLVLSNIKAWEGAIAVARADHDGCIASHRYITCVPDAQVASAAFLALYLQSDHGLARIGRASPGTADRNRTLSLRALQKVRIPLPPIDEQRAIVAQLNALVDRTRQIEAHLRALDQIGESLLVSLNSKYGADRVTRLGDVLQLAEIEEAVTADRTYPQVGVRGFGAGLFAKGPIAGTETSYRNFHRLYEDAIVLSQVKAWEGAIARCPKELDGWFVSPEYRTFRVVEGMADSHYLGSLMTTEWFWSQLGAATRGVGARRERTRPENFLNLRLRLPVFDDQLRIARILERQRDLRTSGRAISHANSSLVAATLERLFERSQ